MMHMQRCSTARSYFVSLLTLIATAGLVACGGGAGDASSPACSLSVKTALDTDSSNPYGDGSGETGPAGDEGDAGPADGMYRNAKVQIQSADGSQGEAEIDGTNGKVHFDVRGCKGPYLLTLKTRADTEYYDESTASFRPVPSATDNDLHAVVPSIDKNIGITMLTEAAYQYLHHKLSADWKDAAKVAQANDEIARVFNGYLPKDMQIPDITRLPVMLKGTTADQSIADTENGVYGVVNAGLARAAGLLRGDAKDASATPAWLISRQISKDLCDGVLDYSCDGTPVLTESDSSQAAYLIPQLGTLIGAGVGDVSARCASPTLVDKSFRIIEAKVDTAFPYGYESCPNCTTRRPRPVYSERTPIWVLGNNGQLYFWDRSSSNLTPAAAGQIFTQLISQGPFIGLAKYDRNAPNANVFARKDINAYADDTPMPRYAPLPALVELSSAFKNTSTVSAFESIVWTAEASGSPWWTARSVVVRNSDGGARYALSNNGIGSPLTSADDAGRNIVAVGQANSYGVGQAGVFLVDAMGKVRAQGSNLGYQLGIGPAGWDGASDMPLTPMNFGDDFIVSVAGRFEGGFAVTSAGQVWGWGSAGVSQALGQDDAPVPVKLAVFGDKKIRRIECTHMHQCVAMTHDGKMLVWGRFPKYTAEEVEAGQDPAAYEDIDKPVEIQNQRVISIGANGWSVHGVSVDGGIVVFLSTVGSMKVLRPATTHTASGSCQQP
jgi:hypothetical protein